MRLKTFLQLVALSLVFVACKDDDNDRFYITFNNYVYEALYFTAGETEPMTITSDVGPPEVALAEGTHSSITYNNDTDVLSWSPQLPLDETIVTVTATSGSRETTTIVILRNKFQGNFSGTYMNMEIPVNVALEFRTDSEGNEITPRISVDGIEAENIGFLRYGTELELTYTIAPNNFTIEATIDTALGILEGAIRHSGEIAPISAFTAAIVP
ncbi:MAG: hypothetical protein AAF934_03350 [Bacteroidota bacterium]